MKKLYVLLSFLLIGMLLFTACKAADTTEDATSAAEETTVDTEAEDTTAAEAETAEETTEDTADTTEEEATTEEETTEVDAPMVYQEAPMLAEMVAAGELPPLEERLPEVPFMVGPGTLIVEEDLPNWESGQYGGELQMAHRGDFPPDVFIGSNEGYLAGPGIGVADIVGNIFERFDVSDDATVFTFYMRKGLKWSDGMPVTREDVEFAWFDVLNNAEINPGGVPGKWRDKVTDVPMVLEFVDDWTFTLTFETAYGSLLREMAISGWVGYTDLVKPAHYLKQFHKDYADEAELVTKIEDAGYEGIEGWVNLFGQKDISNWEAHLEDAIPFPRLYPWILVEMTEGALIYERNPYYYKVDIEGKQLPYIDRIVTARVDDVEMVNVRAIAGQVDFTRESPDVQQLPVYKEQEAAGNFTTGIYSSHVAPMSFMFNHVSTNEAWNEVINDVRFRQAMNYAIDREEVIQTFYFGLAEPAPWNPTEYSVEQANALLDEMGMTERDAKGFRKTPSGKELVFYITSAKYLAEHDTISQLCVEYFAEIGLNAIFETISSDLLNERRAAGDINMWALWAVSPMWVNGTWTDWVPDTPEWARFMNENDEFEGVEPPAEAKRLWEITDARAAAVTGGAEDMALYDETVENYVANLWKIIFVKGINPLIISNDLHNIPVSGQAIAANYSMEQFWLDRDN